MADRMRIDDDGDTAARARLEQIRRMQEQARLQHQETQTQERAAETSRVTEVPPAEAEIHANETRQGQPDAVQVDRAREVHGAELSSEAVDAAHAQQERGEGWERFQDDDGPDVPPSVEEAAKQERDTGRQDEKSRISARELQNQMLVQKGLIKS